MEQFFCKTRILCGSASSQLATLGSKRLLMVSDPFFHKNGTAQRIADGSGCDASAHFFKVTPDPSVSLAAEGTALVLDFQPDTIVALGGGSAMDCAKAMAFFSGTDARLVAIPTTSGSGSEVTDFAILTHNGVKHPLVDQRLCPDVAILDSELLSGLPPALIADAGFDVLTHALEAYTAKNAGAITDALALSAFREAFSFLPASYSGDKAVRPRIHMASTMAGMAFSQAGLGLCHAIAHSLGGAFHIPHGRLNAIVLPAVVNCNAPAATDKYAALAQAIGLEGRAGTVGTRNLRSALIRLRRQLQLPSTLAEAGVSPSQVHQSRHQIIRAALADPCCATNPVPVTEEMLSHLLQEVTGHA